jgi:hypothetical protein
MIRELVVGDIDSIVEIYFGRIDYNNKENPALDPAVKQQWIDAIKKYYLTPNSGHAMYGYFKENILLSYVGWRMDLPAPYHSDWAIAHLKTRPGSFLPSQNGMADLWKKMFEVCESRNLNKWHAVIEDKNWNKFDSFYRRYLPEINNSYTYYDLCSIPANTKPDIEWVWAMIGRRTWSTDLKVRTGERKIL